MDHYDGDNCFRVWDIKTLMDPKSTAESALVCSLDLGSPFSCSRIIADLFQVYVFGAASVILCFSYYIIFEFCNYFSVIITGTKGRQEELSVSI